MERWHAAAFDSCPGRQGRQVRPPRAGLAAHAARPLVACMTALYMLRRSACWRHLYGAFTVWIDSTPDATEEEAPQRGAYSEAEVRVVLKQDEVGSGGSMDLDEVAESVVAQVRCGPRDSHAMRAVPGGRLCRRHPPIHHRSV